LRKNISKKLNEMGLDTTADFPATGCGLELMPVAGSRCQAGCPPNLEARADLEQTARFPHRVVLVQEGVTILHT
jgi:hypothetical protein